jgi:hypothetical protein
VRVEDNNGWNDLSVVRPSIEGLYIVTNIDGDFDCFLTYYDTSYLNNRQHFYLYDHLSGFRDKTKKNIPIHATHWILIPPVPYFTCKGE